MKKLLVFVVFLISVAVAFAEQNPGHPASQIDPGAFPAGNYSLQPGYGLYWGNPTNSNQHVNVDTSGNLWIGKTGGAFLKFDTNGNIGVGTANPASKLDINGVLTVEPVVDVSTIQTNSANSLMNFSTARSSDNWKSFIFTSNNKNLLTILQSGNVGIDTTNPLYALHVAGTVQSDRYRVGPTGISVAYQSGSDLQIGSGASGNPLVFMAGAERMRITDTGYVGIGTTSPGSKLDVNGDINLNGLLKISGASGATGNVLTRTATGMAWQTPAAGGTGVLPSGTSGQTLRNDGTNWVANSVLFNNGASVGIGTTIPNSNTWLQLGAPSGAVYGTLSLKSKNYVGGGYGGIWLEAKDNTNAIAIFHTGSLGVIRTDWTGTGGYTAPLAIIGSSVGIGMTPSSGEMLDVAGNIHMAGHDPKIYMVDTTGGGGQKSFSLRSGYSADGMFQIWDDTANVNRLAIDTNGNVGIGTTNPSSYKLNVAGGSYGTLSTGSTYGLYGASSNYVGVRGDGSSAGGFFYNTGTGSSAYLGDGSYGLYTNNPISVDTTTTGSIELIKGDGTSWVSSTLQHLNGANPDMTWYRVLYPGNPGYAWDEIYNVDRYSIYIGGAGEALTVKSTGNVGIGTTSPSYKLDVSGDARVSTLSIGFTPSSGWGIKSYGSSVGVYGETNTGNAVQGYAYGNGNGIHGYSTSGYAGYFNGNVKIASGGTLSGVHIAIDKSSCFTSVHEGSLAYGISGGFTGSTDNADCFVDSTGTTTVDTYVAVGYRNDGSDDRVLCCKLIIAAG